MKNLFLSAALAVTLPLPALAGDTIHIIDPYARSAHGMAQSGAAFMTIANHGSEDRRLIAARSDAAQRVELHTHIEDDAGVMRMIEVEEGFAIPAGGEYSLARGGDHIMLMGLTAPFEQGDEIAVTLIFADDDEMEITIPIDMERSDSHGHSHDHSHEHTHD